MAGAKKSGHEGHRARMRARYDRTQFESFEPHEALEMILFGAIPVRNVNPLAHDLITRFGSVSGTLAADEKALIAVPGIGAVTAKYLKLVHRAAIAYRSGEQKPPRFLNQASFTEYCQTHFTSGYDDHLWLFNLRGNCDLLSVTPLPRADDACALNARAIVEPSLACHAKAVILLDMRASDDPSFEPGFLDILREAQEQLSALGVLFMDAIVRTVGGYRSARAARLIAPPIALREQTDVGRVNADWLDTHIHS